MPLTCDDRSAAGSAGVPPKAAPHILALYRLPATEKETRLHSVAIEAAVAATDSEIGYFHMVNEDQETLELGTWSPHALQIGTAVYDRHYPISAAGTWADAARSRRPVVHNDYPAASGQRGLPDGHAVLRRHMGVPVLENGEMRLLVGVGNKPEAYTTADLDALQFIANETWRLISEGRERYRLALAAEHLLEIQRLMPVSIWRWDPAEQRFNGDDVLNQIFRVPAADDTPWTFSRLLALLDDEDRSRLEAQTGVISRTTSISMEARARRASGKPITLSIRARARSRAEGPGYTLDGLLQDISDMRSIADVHHAATHDSLTELFNRRVLFEALAQHTAQGRRDPGDRIALHFVDLDRFKLVNDRFGHQAGDALLRTVAQRLLSVTRAEDIVARIGGDELVVLQREVADETSALRMADKIVETLGAPYSIGGTVLHIGASIGIALSQEEPESADAILRRADEAMYRAKHGDAGPICIATRLPAVAIST